MVPRPSVPLLTYQRRWPGGLDRDLGSGEIDGFHAEVEFFFDPREAGEALGGEGEVKEVFCPLSLDGNQVGGDFFCGGFAGPDQGAEVIDGSVEGGIFASESQVFEPLPCAGEVVETLDHGLDPAVSG